MGFLSLCQDQYNTSPYGLLGKERSPFEAFFGKRCNFDLLLLREDCRESEEIGKRLISLEKNRRHILPRVLETLDFQ